MSDYITIPTALWEKTRKQAAANGGSLSDFKMIAMKVELDALRAKVAEFEAKAKATPAKPAKPAK